MSTDSRRERHAAPNATASEAGEGRVTSFPRRPGCALSPTPLPNVTYHQTHKGWGMTPERPCDRDRGGALSPVRVPLNLNRMRPMRYEEAPDGHR